MSDKNGKALALELIDDLLNDDTSADVLVNPSSPPPSISEHTEPTATPPSVPAFIADVENDRTVNLSEPLVEEFNPGVESDLTVPLSEAERLHGNYSRRTHRNSQE